MTYLRVKRHRDRISTSTYLHVSFLSHIVSHLCVCACVKRKMLWTVYYINDFASLCIWFGCTHFLCYKSYIWDRIIFLSLSNSTHLDGNPSHFSHTLSLSFVSGCVCVFVCLIFFYFSIQLQFFCSFFVAPLPNRTQNTHSTPDVHFYRIATVY